MYKLAINRPIATLMYALTLIIFGLYSFKVMPSSLFPKVDFPIVTIKTIYPGADASTIESRVTNKIEEKIATINGIDKIISTSSDSVSVITVQFFLSRDIDEAANDIRDKVSAVVLPKDAKKPLISKLDIGGASVINIFFAAKNQKDFKKLMPLIDDKIKPLLQQIEGVGAINAIGYRDREIKIFPNLDKLNAHNITLQELEQIIQAQNLNLSGGKIINNKNEIILKTKTEATSIKELEQIQIAPHLFLKDVATIKDTLSDAKSYAALNRKQGVMLEVQKISGANTLEVVKRVKKALPQIKALASNYEVKLLNDTTIFIKNSLNSVKFDLIYGIILSVLIIFLFLRNVKITFLSALAIPSSVLGTFALMHFMGFGLNKLTLIGLTLAIGIIIDDAIVVVENIYKKLEAGHSKLEAAFLGVKEIAFAVFAISAMLLAVFIPVGSMSGIVGKFFESFAITVAFAIIISYSVAMSLIPSFSARVLDAKKSRFYIKTEKFFHAIESIYAKILSVTLRHKALVLITTLAIFIGSLALFPKIGMDFIPKEDKSEFEIKLKTKPGISLEAMIQKVQTIANLVRKDKNVLFTTTSIGYNAAKEIHKAKIYVKLIDKEKRALHQNDIVQSYRKKLKQFEKDFFITVGAIPNIKGVGADVPYQIILKSTNFALLEKTAKELVAHLKKKKGFVDIDTNLDGAKPQIDIKLKKDMATLYGVLAIDVAKAINIAYSSDLAISHIKQNGKEFDITLRLSNKDRTTLQNLQKIMLRSKSGALIPLTAVVKIKPSFSQAAIKHFDRERQITIFANLYGLDLGGAIKYTNAWLKKHLPKEVGFRYSGFAEEMGKTAKAFGMAAITSIILMYIILAILYESLIQPIIIMMALPLSIIGVMIALFLSKTHFSLFVMIGFMLLMGMVGKNGVLLVDFANELVYEKKQELKEALIHAGQMRLRPILMTTFAMIFAMLPLALGHGAGNETKAPMAIAIIGGLISSTILTLLVIPAIYGSLYKIDKFLRKFYEVGKVQ